MAGRERNGGLGGKAEPASQPIGERSIERGAAAGEPALVALRDTGVPHAIRAAAEWVARHRSVLGR